MRVVMFYHSLVSDWNHGNAHFLRGVATELLSRGHEVRVYEPRDGWSLQNLLAEQGPRDFVAAFHRAYPALRSEPYDLATLDLDSALHGADLVLVHEWNDPNLVRRLGEYRRRHTGLCLFFHDTHHRLVTAPASMDAYDLTGYDGVLAFGEVLRELYARRGWGRRAFTFHEAADTRVFHPPAGLVPGPPGQDRAGDLVWIGNWGDEERTAELTKFLIEPVRALSLSARAHGVRYPDEARRYLQEARISYEGFLPNFEVPSVFARFEVTLHVPRRPYVEALPGIPTIRVFEALACGIPLLCSPWEDAENLFHTDQDFLIAKDGEEMKQMLRDVLHDPGRAQALRTSGLDAIRSRHTCAHRVDELLKIAAEIAGPARSVEKTSPTLGQPRGAH